MYKNVYKNIMCVQILVHLIVQLYTSYYIYIYITNYYLLKGHKIFLSKLVTNKTYSVLHNDNEKYAYNEYKPNG